MTEDNMDDIKDDRSKWSNERLLDEFDFLIGWQTDPMGPGPSKELVEKVRQEVLDRMNHEKK